MPSNIPLATLLPMPWESVVKDSKPLFNKFKPPSKVGCKDIFPNSAPSSVKLTKVRLIKADKVSFNFPIF